MDKKNDQTIINVKIENNMIEEEYVIEDITIEGNDYEGVTQERNNEDEDNDTTQFVTYRQREELEKIVGTFEGVLEANKIQLYHITTENAWYCKEGIIGAMENYKDCFNNMRWYVIKDKITILSGYWKGGWNRYDREAKQYYKKDARESERVVCRCVETGIEFTSYNKAADAYDVKPTSIRLACKWGWEAAGLHWVGVDSLGYDIPYEQYGSYRKESMKERKANKKEKTKKEPRKKRISTYKYKCLETNVIYLSLQEAADSVACTTMNISIACKYGRPAKGHHWAKIRLSDGQVVPYEEFVDKRKKVKVG